MTDRPSRPSRLEAAYAWVREHPYECDALFAAALSIGLVALPILVTEVTYGATALSLGLIVPLGWRRRAPVLSALWVAGFGVLQLLTDDHPVLADVAVVLALYAVTAYGPNWAGQVALIAAFVGGLLAANKYEHIPNTAFYVTLLVGFIATLVLAAWALGTMRRLRIRDEARLQERARLLELERDQETRLAATAERTRIAREMHDVVAHSLSVTISQADGGRYAAQQDPEAAIAALETISVTGRQALGDMRVLLGVLRSDQTQDLAPQPDVEAIPELLDQVRNSGLEIQLEIIGSSRPLSAGPALAAYRIVQESLTNVLKHAGPQACAWVRLAWLPDALEVWVVDDGRGAAAIPGGSNSHGLIGMRERAALHSGLVEAGPRPGGGFGVRAVLPYPTGGRP
jgi:signal transduction histidine kinase